MDGNRWVVACEQADCEWAEAVDDGHRVTPAASYAPCPALPACRLPESDDQFKHGLTFRRYDIIDDYRYHTTVVQSESDLKNAAKAVKKANWIAYI